MNKFSKWTRCWLISLMLIAAAKAATAQTATQLYDTVRRADGTPAHGTVLVSWPAFTTSAGQNIARGNTSITLANDGTLTASLSPNSGAQPIGTYYTAVYHLDDGSISREYWVIPVSSAPVTLQAVRSSVLPTSVAMQTVTKQYVDQTVAKAALGSIPSDGTPYIMKTGDSMAGPLTLSSDPTSGQQAATKNYVDTNVAALQAGVGLKVASTPQDSQTVVQPPNTELKVNRINGALDVSQFKGPSVDWDGLSNTLSQPECVNGCYAIINRNYLPQDRADASAPSRTHIVDHRGGSQWDYYVDPHSFTTPGLDMGQHITVAQIQSASDVKAQTGSESPGSYGLWIDHLGLAGGNNLFPQNITSSVPYFKSTFSALALIGNYYTGGQHVLDNQQMYCYGVGDCLAGARYVYDFGGYRDNADEGTHAYDFELREDPRVFQGVCASGCTTGSTQLAITATQNGGTQGEGRFLINTSPSKVISTGTLTGGNPTGSPFPTATFTGSNFPVSTFFMLASAALPQAKNIAPGSFTSALQTTGLPSGFLSSASGIASGGVACVADNSPGGGSLSSNYEMANYTVVDSSHLNFIFNKPHAAGAIVAIGGLCGYGLEQTVDTVNGIRQVFPVIGSTSPTSLFYASGIVPIVASTYSTSAYKNFNLNIASIARNNGVVTITTSANMPQDLNGLTLTIAGVADSSYNGQFAVTTTNSNTMTYSQTGADGTSSGGTVSFVTGGYKLYPMAEALNVINPVSHQPDGTLTLAPNTVAWAPNDPVEMPHYYQMRVGGDARYISQFQPRPSLYVSQGVTYLDNVGMGLRGWFIENRSPITNYIGNGGTRIPPDFGMMVDGEWNTSLSLKAGDKSAIAINCNSRGCNRWNSTYNLFELQSNAGTDTVTYSPQTSNMNFNLHGAQYNFTPTGLTLDTLTANHLNAPLDASHVTGLGTSATVNTGTSGATVPLLNGSNTWSNQQTFTTALIAPGGIAFNGNFGYIASSGNAGPILIHNAGDANAAVTSYNAHAAATGHIHDFKNSTGVVSYVSNNGMLHAPLYTPPSSSAPCSPGDFADDANYHYVCVATNTWKRAALSNF